MTQNLFYLVCLHPGHEEVMFIHTHYSHLSEIISGDQEPSLKHPDKVERLAAFFYYLINNIYCQFFGKLWS